MINLKDIALDTKETIVEFPGFDGFKITLAYVSRQTSKSILEQSEKKVFKNGMHVDNKRDDEVFADLYTSAAIKGWTGLTLEHVSHLMLIDIGARDPKEEVPYSPDNAKMLFTNSAVFSAFVDRSVFEIETFRSR